MCTGSVWNLTNIADCLGQVNCGPDVRATECPESPFPMELECSVNPDSRICEYGTVSCCGEDHPEIILECANGMWNHHLTDACFHSCGTNDTFDGWPIVGCPSLEGPDPIGQLCSGSPKTCEYNGVHVGALGPADPHELDVGHGLFEPQDAYHLDFFLECQQGHWNINYGCPDGEEFKQCDEGVLSSEFCGEPSCADPFPAAGTTLCRPQCQCEGKMRRRSDGKCVPKRDATCKEEARQTRKSARREARKAARAARKAARQAAREANLEATEPEVQWQDR